MPTRKPTYPAGLSHLFSLCTQIGRGERIRTSDPLVPNQVRYQTALRPELPSAPFTAFQTFGLV